jgi:hypothetical protein
MRLLAIDPGFAQASGCGYAYFRDGLLERVGVIPSRPELPLRDRARIIWRSMWAGGPDAEPLAQHSPWNLEGCRVDYYVVELPRVYPGPKQMAPPNDLVDLAYLAGALDGIPSDGEIVHPRTWKGSVPKKVMTKRIENALSPHERAILARISGARRHNAIDAVGLGKWKLAATEWKGTVG